MSRNALIDKSMKSLETLPENKIHEVIDFIDFLSNRHHEEKVLRQGVAKMASESDCFSFLSEEEDIYDETDLIEKY